MENRIQEVMNERGLSYREVSDLTGGAVNASTIYRIATVAGNNPSLETAALIAKALKVPLKRLFLGL